MEIANTINVIFPSRRIKDAQSSVAGMRKATITEFQLCMTIVAMILRKRSNDL